MIEIERRYRIDNPEEIIDTLAKLDMKETSKTQVIDQWFIPPDIRGLQEQEDWFDNGGTAYRIRRTNGVMEVGAKRVVNPNDHSALHEETIDIDNYDDAVQYMKDHNLRNWLTVDKVRRTFDTGRTDVSIILDEIAGMRDKIGFDASLEIEYTGDNEDEARQTLDKVVAQLGLSSEQEMAKGLAVYAAQELADFTS